MFQKESELMDLYLKGAYEYSCDVFDDIECMHKPYLETARAKRTMLYPYLGYKAKYIGEFYLDYLVKFIDRAELLAQASREVDIRQAENRYFTMHGDRALREPKLLNFRKNN